MKLPYKALHLAILDSIEDLKREHQTDDVTYWANLRHNAGRYKYFPINKAVIFGKTYYGTPALPYAYNSRKTLRTQIDKFVA